MSTASLKSRGPHSSFSVLSARLGFVVRLLTVSPWPMSTVLISVGTHTLLDEAVSL